MSTSRKEEIIKKGFLKSILDGTIEIKDLAGINPNLDMARQAYLQGLFETMKAVLDSVQKGVEPYPVSQVFEGWSPIVKDVEKELVTIEGVGYCDLIIAGTSIGPFSEKTHIHIYLDDEFIFCKTFFQLNYLGFDADSHPIALTKYGVDTSCYMMISKRWDFKKNLSIKALNTDGNVSSVSVELYPNMLTEG